MFHGQENLQEYFVLIIFDILISNREQCDREQALDDIKTGETHILIATDVASRGLDVKDITYVLF